MDAELYIRMDGHIICSRENPVSHTYTPGLGVSVGVMGSSLSKWSSSQESTHSTTHSLTHSLTLKAIFVEYPKELLHVCGLCLLEDFKSIEVG